MHNIIIALGVSGNDNVSGITKYYYKIGNNEYIESDSTSYTFSGLSGGTSYTVSTYAKDVAGNTSVITSQSISTEKLAKDTILANMTTITTRSDFSAVYTASTIGTIFTAEDGDGTSYYFAGAPTDNWVKFGDYYWRIVRINGDGTIRLIYNGTSTATTGTGTLALTSSYYNQASANNMYVGYMYTSVNAHGYGTNSTIKTKVDSWYDSKLASYESYIDINAGFCNDRVSYTDTSGSISGGGTGTTQTYYAAYIRLTTVSKNYSPTLKCTISNDLFTLSSSNKGNKKLSKPIGLITADEVAYAGGVHSTSNGKTDNTSYYLYNNQFYWTMTPHSYSSSSEVFLIGSTGRIFSNVMTNGRGVRPVINLRADITLSGTGTTDNPYTVS